MENMTMPGAAEEAVAQSEAYAAAKALAAQPQPTLAEMPLEDIVKMPESEIRAKLAAQMVDAVKVVNPPVEGVDFNIPLSDSQKLLISRIQIKKLDLAKQKADIEANEAKVDAYFHGQLVKIGQDNKIDMEKFVLSEDLEIKPMPKQPVPAPRR
jgi:hypothetical protein